MYRYEFNCLYRYWFLLAVHVLQFFFPTAYWLFKISAHTQLLLCRRTDCTSWCILGDVCWLVSRGSSCNMVGGVGGDAGWCTGLNSNNTCCPVMSTTLNSKFSCECNSYWLLYCLVCIVFDIRQYAATWRLMHSSRWSTYLTDTVL